MLRVLTWVRRLSACWSGSCWLRCRSVSLNASRWPRGALTSAPSCASRRKQHGWVHLLRLRHHCLGTVAHSGMYTCALQVSDVYLLVQQTMTQPLMKDYVPFPWASMVQVKSEHFRALSHYYAAAALCDHTCESDVTTNAAFYSS